MTTQNLISAELTAEKVTEILQAITTIRTNLDFLLTLQPDERRGLFSKRQITRHMYKKTTL